MNTLHDQLSETVSDVTIDLAELNAVARRRGTAQRRIRRSLATVGSAAAIVAIGVGGWALGTDEPTVTDRSTFATSPAGATSAPAASASAEEPTARLNGRIAAAIARESLSDALVSQGVEPIPLAAENNFRGQGGIDLIDPKGGSVVVSAADDSDVYAEMTIAGDDGKSTFSVNVQQWSSGVREGGCSSIAEARECELHKVLIDDPLWTWTYRRDDDKPGSSQLVAALINEASNLRVVVMSSAPTVTAHSVTADVLAAVASDPVWGFEVPAEYAAKGDALTTYKWLPTGGGLVPDETIETPVPDVG